MARTRAEPRRTSRESLRSCEVSTVEGACLHGSGERAKFLSESGRAFPARPAQANESIAAPIILERPAPGVEIELVGGRRVRFDRDVDPETMKRVISMLEGTAP